VDRRRFLTSALGLGALAASGLSGCAVEDLLSPSKKAQPGAPQPLTLGPFRGVWDSTDPMDQLEKFLFGAVNMQFVDAKDGGGVLARHGLMGRTTQYGDSSHRLGQCVYKHLGIGGTIYNYQFTGGKMYQWAGTDTDHTLLAPTVTISQTNRIFCASFNGLLIVSDETNPPWVWDPVALTSTVINVDSVPSAWNTKGGPVIYGGKIIFAVKSIGGTFFRNAIVWCEELQATVGYKQTGFNNYWQLIQTGTDVIGALAAEENGLYIIRNKGIGLITGVVNADFKTNATRDTISATVGTDCPASVVLVDNWVYFLDMDGRPFRMRANGGEPEPLWLAMRRIFDARTASVTNPASRAVVATNGAGMYHEKYNLVLFTIWDKLTIYAFDAATGSFVGQWLVGNNPFADDTTLQLSGPPYGYAGYYIDAMGSLQDANNQPAMCMIGFFAPPTSPPGPTQYPGVFWRQKGLSDYAPWADQWDASSNTTTLLRQTVSPHRLETRSIRGGPRATVRLVAVAATVTSHGDPNGALGSTHVTNLAYLTPVTFNAGNVVSIPAVAPATGADANANDATSVARWGGFTPNAQGAWLRLIFQPFGQQNPNGSDNDSIEPDLAYRWGVYDAAIAYLVTPSRQALIYP
jgi:hypothetical protein